MSVKYPIIAATGSSGAGTSTVTRAFDHIFRRMAIKPVFVEGDAFHAYDRKAMQDATTKASIRGENFSHFGPAANHFERLEELFRSYADGGTGTSRRYLHDDEAYSLGVTPGTFTEWETLSPNTDMLFYEGLHGAVITDHVDVAKYVDLLIGIVPTINLEWNQKIARDITDRGYDPETVEKNILRRMRDYVQYIVPQFSRTDINFQRVPTVDTSNPFAMTEIPTADESYVVIHVRDRRKLQVDFPYMLTMIESSFMSRADTIVVPGGKLGMAIELIFTPAIEEMIGKRRALMV